MDLNEPNQKGVYPNGLKAAEVECLLENREGEERQNMLAMLVGYKVDPLVEALGRWKDARP